LPGSTPNKPKRTAVGVIRREPVPPRDGEAHDCNPAYLIDNYKVIDFSDIQGTTNWSPKQLTLVLLTGRGHRSGGNVIA
jgi:hypothetical protein